MGILYKLMKHKKINLDFKMPENNINIKTDRNRLITIEGNIIEAPVAQSTPDSIEDDLMQYKDSNTDKQFTAEHIIQLCKFLAEKSRKNKSLYKQQTSPKKLTKSKQSQFTFQSIEYNDNDDDINFYQSEALPLLSKQRLEQQIEIRPDTESVESDEFEEQKHTAVLSTRLSADINSLNISLNAITATSCVLQHHQQQQQPQSINNYNQHQQQQHQPQQPQTQGKRDILLKIRRQIIERKRLRENGAFEPQALNNSQVWRPW